MKRTYPFVNLRRRSTCVAMTVIVSALLAFFVLIHGIFGASIVDDSTCIWSSSAKSCEPSAYCSYQFLAGDVTKDQSCRVAKGRNKIPQQFRLAFAGVTAGTGMTISWSTFADVSDNTVWIGPSSDALTASTINVSTSSYYSEADYTQFQQVTGLRPNTRYYYRVGSKANSSLQSDVYSFKAARAADDTSTFKVAVFGDMGDGDNSVHTIKYLNSLNSSIDFVWHLGDISYADDYQLNPSQANGFFYEEVYNKWMNSLATVMRSVPYMVLVGNHDVECTFSICKNLAPKRSHLGSFAAYNARFKMPSAESGGVLNLWHSFDHGPIHFTSISTETDNYFSISKEANRSVQSRYYGDQLRWLEADLKKANSSRTNVPWMFVGMHRPLYSVARQNRSGNQVQEDTSENAFEALFIKYGVDVVVAGHTHCYERNLPIANGNPVLAGVSSDNSTYTNAKAPVYIITGSAGNVEKLYASAGRAPWNVAIDYSHYGFSMLTASRTSLQWEFVASADQSVKDSFMMVRS